MSDRGLGVEHAAQRIRLGPELDARDVAQIHDVARRVRLDDDVRELVFGLQPAERVHDVRELGAGQRRLSADAPGRDFGVLFAHGAQHVVDGHVACAILSGSSHSRIA